MNAWDKAWDKAVKYGTAVISLAMVSHIVLNNPGTEAAADREHCRKNHVRHPHLPDQWWCCKASHCYHESEHKSNYGVIHGDTAVEQRLAKWASFEKCEHDVLIRGQHNADSVAPARTHEPWCVETGPDMATCCGGNLLDGYTPGDDEDDGGQYFRDLDGYDNAKKAEETEAAEKPGSDGKQAS